MSRKGTKAMKKFWLLFLLLLAACSPNSRFATPTNSSQSTPQAISTVPVTRSSITPVITDTPVATSTLSSSTAFVALPTPSLSDGLEPHDSPISPTRLPTPEPEYTCPFTGTAETNFESESLESLKNSILAYLNEGGGWETLTPLLSEQEAEAVVTAVDFNKDSINEVIMSVGFEVEQYETEYATWVFQCRNSNYEVVFQIWWGFYHDRERIVDIVDLNDDSFPEVVLESLWVGSACTYELTIIGWQPDKGFVNHAPSHLELEFGCGGEITIDDLDGDNVKEIIIEGETVFHQAYGPTREIIQKFQLIDDFYHLIETEYLPSTLRIHIFDDAQRALDSGDILLAAQLYDQAAHDPTLEDYPSKRFPPGDGYNLDHPNEYQRSFALFRLVVIRYFLEETEDLDGTLAELGSSFPEGSFGNEFAILAHLYIEQRTIGVSATDACSEVANYIEENFPDLDAHIGDWGLNFAYYNSNTICPVL